MLQILLQEEERGYQNYLQQNNQTGWCCVKYYGEKTKKLKKM
jgi:hypothetical protein